MDKKEIEKIKQRIEIETKDHVLTEEVNTNVIKSYLFKKPDSGIYWMRAIQTNYGLHLEGDCGCLQICYKTFGWLAGGDSIDYQMSKLSEDYSKKETLDPVEIKQLVKDMIRYKRENKDHFRRNKRSMFDIESKKLILFTDEEREFFEELKECKYKPDCSAEEFYRRIYDLTGWEDYLCDGIYITDYDWSIYWRFFCLKKVAQEIIKYGELKEQKNSEQEKFLDIKS